MGRIRRLDPVVANQIAAGEVVERPASVVKELVENSLDAGCTTVRVTVADGGRTVTVRDNGAGIEADDLAHALERHSTSKLTRLEDLETSRTLGFRGEALAAIASVSHLTLASRPPHDASGHQITAEFGRVTSVEPMVMAEGTHVAVERIFERQPARLKALKTPAAELGAIQHVLQQLAIGCADVQFILQHEGREILSTPGQGDATAAVLAVFGREIAASLIPIGHTSEWGAQVHGLIAPAERHRANRFGQGLYVNGRWIQNWLLRAGVEEAFRPITPERRFPYFWIWIDLPPDQVDPNAHPTKAEVRVVREHALRALLHRIVQEALAADSPAPHWVDAADGASHAAGEPQRFEWSLDRGNVQPSERPVLHREFQELVPLAQWRAKYIIAQGAEGLYLIDQHAAHERIYFEHFSRLGQTVTTSQPLMLAVPETLSAVEWAQLEAHRPVLAKWGFEVSDLGGTTVSVRAVPTAFRDLESHQGLLRTLLEMLSGGGTASGTEHPIGWAEEARYAMAACKAAIKANRALSMAEMSALIDDLSRVADARGCPHGRPTTVVLTLREVDRRFGRRG